MISKRACALSVVVPAIFASLLLGTPTPARDQMSSAPKLVRSHRLGRPVPTTIPGWRWASLTCVAWSPDGRHIAVGGWPGYGVRLWNVGTGKEERFRHDHS